MSGSDAMQRFAADLARTGERRQIGNLDALHRAIRKAGLGHILDDPST